MFVWEQENTTLSFKFSVLQPWLNKHWKKKMLKDKLAFMQVSELTRLKTTVAQHYMLANTYWQFHWKKSTWKRFQKFVSLENRTLKTMGSSTHQWDAKTVLLGHM